MTRDNSRYPVGNRVAIYKRGRRGFYTADFHHDGRHCRRALKTKDKRAAVSKALEIDQQLAKGALVLHELHAPARPARSTVVAAWEAYLQDKRTGGRRPKTVAKYDGILRKFEEFCREQRLMHLDQISLRTIDAFRQHRSGQVGDKQMHHDARTLKDFFAWCVARDMMAANPMAAQRYPRPRAKRKERVLTLAQVDAILTAAPARIRPVLAVLAFTGMRSGNARHLLVEDVDLKQGWIHVRSRPGAETKGGNHWKVPVHARLSRILQALPRRPSGFFFTAPPSPRYPEGGHWINTKHLNEDFQKVLKRLKLPAGRQDGFTIHDLRHFFKSFCLSHGVPREYVDAWQGHVGVSRASDLYVHTFDDASRRWMNQTPFDGAAPDGAEGLGSVSSTV